MSSSDALSALLAVRQAALDQAALALAAALRRRAAAEEAQRRLEAELATARGDLRARRRAAPSLGVETAAQAAERERFWQRLAGDIDARADRVHAHRDGSLADAEAGVVAARAAHRQAREARELVQKLVDRADSERRQIADRRAEAALDDQAAARARMPRHR
jgi:flagellar biosynthesis chaperone FliJ